MLLCSAWDNGSGASLAFFILIQVLGCYIVVSIMPWQHSAVCLIAIDKQAPGLVKRLSHSFCSCLRALSTLCEEVPATQSVTQSSLDSS